MMNSKMSLVLSTAVIVTVALGCSGQPGAQEARVDQPAGEPSHQAAAQNSNVIEGTVIETMNAAGYTYLKVDTGDGEIWAAASAFEIEKGERVTIPLEMPMEQFHSETLDRTFDLIYFVSVVGREGVGDHGVETEDLGLPPGHPTLDAMAADGGAPVDVAIPSGSTPIADVWAGRSELAGTTVIVTGKVVKFNSGILGTNWMHLQDGSGSADQGDHDLTVTGDFAVEVGGVVTATGTLSVDKDFGAGYAYGAILENAVVAKQ